jgi:predicted transcriptional regulator
MTAVTAPAINTPVDLEALHRILWRLSDSQRHRLHVEQRQLAEELDVTVFTLNRCMRRLVDGGQLRSLGRAGRSVLYIVATPTGL